MTAGENGNVECTFRTGRDRTGIRTNTMTTILRHSSCRRHRRHRRRRVPFPKL